MTNLVKKTRAKRYFYAKDVNMNYSFDTLADMAKKQLGAEPEVGDIIICDNRNGDKRKMLQITKDGFMIYYGRLKDSVFQALAEHNGMLKAPNKEIL
jgi:hypothetical protein